MLRTGAVVRDPVTNALLLFLYNSGARADEAAQLLVGDLDIALSERDYSSVRIRGKGNKVRCSPLYSQTVNQLKAIINNRRPADRVFRNRCRQPITRFGIHAMVVRYAARVAKQMPALAARRVSPHSIRHTTATHLLRDGVDINTIRAWLGHVSPETTNIYAETDLEMKAKALACCEVRGTARKKRWRDD
jgi:integrase/recombinase XerD